VRVCVHRGECMRVYMSVCVCTVFLKKKVLKPNKLVAIKNVNNGKKMGILSDRVRACTTLQSSPTRLRGRHETPRRLRAAATMAAALRLLLRQHAAPPPSPILRSLIPAPYSKVRLNQFRCLILLKPSPRLGALTSLPSPGRRRRR
jgi:hypothetical protein